MRMDNEIASGETKMLRAYFVLIGGVLTGGFLLLAVVSSAHAGTDTGSTNPPSAEARNF